jgi:hypothetical protein
MKCFSPPPLTDEMLALILDGHEDEDGQRHLAQCPACAARLAKMRRFDSALQERLHRFECPSPQRLADYHAGMLDTIGAESIRQHLTRCPRCQEELNMLDEFINLEPEETETTKIVPLAAPKNVIVATRVETSGSLALKGVENEATYDMKAGSASIFLESRMVPKGFLLMGQVVDTQVNWIGAIAEAWQEGSLQQVRTLDDTCEFRFEFATTTPIILYITSTTGTTLMLGNVSIQVQ